MHLYSWECEKAIYGDVNGYCIKVRVVPPPILYVLKIMTPPRKKIHKTSILILNYL